MFSLKRCLADSNCCRRFCRPLTKPLIQGTIIKFACKGNTIIRSDQTNLVFFSFFAPTVPQQFSEGNGENGGSKCIAQLRYRHQSSVNRAQPFLSHPCRTSPTMRRPCLVNASPRLSDPCGTSAALPLPRPSLATKESGQRLAASTGEGILAPATVSMHYIGWLYQKRFSRTHG